MASKKVLVLKGILRASRLEVLRIDVHEPGLCVAPVAWPISVTLGETGICGQKQSSILKFRVRISLFAGYKALEHVHHALR